MSQFYSRTESSKDTWETPPIFFEKLDNIFHFTLDPCASEQNKKCEKYYSIEQNGLIQNWNNEKVFVNPPFSNFKEWLKKAWEETTNNSNTTVVMIIPSRTDTKAWHDYVMKSDEIWFCIPRVNFLINGLRPKNGSTFPLSVIIFRKTTNTTPLLRTFAWKPYLNKINKKKQPSIKSKHL